MKKKLIPIFLILFVVCVSSTLVTAQTYINVKMTQPVPLLSNAGEDQHIPNGGSVQIFGTISGGVPPYIYKWSPGNGLSGTTISDPTASPDVTTSYTLTVTDAKGCKSMDSVVVFVGPTGIDEFSKSNSFAISPNPSEGLFTISLTNIFVNKSIRLEIFDSQGKLVYVLDQTMDEKASLRIPINFSEMVKGIYLVKIITNRNAQYGQKLIIE